MALPKPRKDIPLLMPFEMKIGKKISRAGLLHNVTPVSPEQHVLDFLRCFDSLVEEITLRTAQSSFMLSRNERSA